MATALEYLHSLPEKSSRFDRRTTTSAGTATTLVCSDYVNSVWASTQFASFWVLIESGSCAGEVGVLTDGGLTPTSGTLTTADAFSSSIASGVTFSLYPADRLPPIRKGDTPGYLQMVNLALERLPAPLTITVSGVTNQIHYTVDTATYPGLTDDTRIDDILLPTTAADDVPRVLSRSRWSWVSDGETKKLRFPGAPFKTGETFGIKAKMAGNARLKLGANLRAVLTGTAVTSVTVLSGGYYTVLPTITPSSGAAAFTAVMAATPGPITSVTVTNAGAYTASFPPALTVTRNALDTGWAYQTTQTAGLVSLTDEAIPDVRFVRAMGLAMTFAALAEMGAPGQTEAEWLAKAARWEQTAAQLKQTATPRDRDTGVVRLRPTALRGARRRFGSAWTR